MKVTMRSLGSAFAVVVMLWCGVTPAGAQTATDTLAYELVTASVLTTGRVEVEFGKSFPKRYLDAGGQMLQPATEWVIELRELSNPAAVRLVAVTGVFVDANPAQTRLVELVPSETIHPTTNQVRVRLLLGNFPEVMVARPHRQGADAAFGPANGKDDADLYFKGLVVSSTGSGPAYSVDAKAGYTARLGVQGGSLGAKGTYLVDKASDIGPDSITVGASYSKIFVFAPATAIILDSEPFGFELDAKNDTRNLRSTATGQLVIPPWRLAPLSFAAADFLAGFEAGGNQKNAISDDAYDTFWRTVFGANGYLLLQGAPVVKRIDITAAWKVRVLAQNEPFTERVNGTDMTALTDRPRHSLTITTAFMITKAFGFSAGYRHGSEPPTFKYVRHRGELGLLFKLKQIGKG